MRRLKEEHIALIASALGIARDCYKANAETIEKAGMQSYGGLVEQFRRQALEAELLRQAFEDYPEVTLSVDGV